MDTLSLLRKQRGSQLTESYLPEDTDRILLCGLDPDGQLIVLAGATDFLDLQRLLDDAGTEGSLADSRFLQSVTFLARNETEQASYLGYMLSLPLVLFDRQAPSNRSFIGYDNELFSWQEMRRQQINSDNRDLLPLAFAV